MTDGVLKASILELGCQLDDLRNALPTRPVMEFSRLAFDALPAGERMAAVRRGAKVFDGPPSAPRRPDGAILRSDFDKLGPAERHKLIRGGHLVCD